MLKLPDNNNEKLEFKEDEDLDVTIQRRKSGLGSPRIVPDKKKLHSPLSPCITIEKPEENTDLSSFKTEDMKTEGSSENNTPREDTINTPKDDSDDYIELEKKMRPRMLSEEFNMSKKESKYFQKMLLENVKKNPSLQDMNVNSTSSPVINPSFSSSFTINRLSNNLSFIHHNKNEPVRMSQDEMLLTKLKILEREAKERKIMDMLITTHKIEYTSKGLPLSGVVLMKIMQNYDSFSPINDGFSQKVIKTLKLTIEKISTDSEQISYWIGNLCVILNIIKQEYPITDTSEPTEQKYKLFTDKKKIGAIVKDDSFFGYSLNLDPKVDNQDMKVESNVSEFKYQIEQLLTLSYSYLLMNIYSTLSNLIEKCMFSNETEKQNTKQIVSVFEQYYKLMIQNLFLNDIIACFFDQVFYFIENHILNIFLQNQKYHTMGYSIILKLNSGVLTDWIYSKKLKILNLNLELIKEITMILMVNKDMLLDEEFIKETCPSITMKEISVFVSSYHSDEYDQLAHVPSVVLKKFPKEKSIELRNEYIIFDLQIKNYVELNSWRILEVPNTLKTFEEELRSPRRSSLKVE